MKVCTHLVFTVVVLTRNEHCPPHVHIGTPDWDARFEFSFWHGAVRLWDVIPTKGAPEIRLLEELRQVVKADANLRRARTLWWQSRQTLCLENQAWDLATSEVVSPKVGRHGSVAIVGGFFDAVAYRTFLRLQGQQDLLEIAL
jgi:hypothetical protein